MTPRATAPACCAKDTKKSPTCARPSGRGTRSGVPIPIPVARHCFLAVDRSEMLRFVPRGTLIPALATDKTPRQRFPQTKIQQPTRRWLFGSAEPESRSPKPEVRHEISQPDRRPCHHHCGGGGRVLLRR